MFAVPDSKDEDDMLYGINFVDYLVIAHSQRKRAFVEVPRGLFSSGHATGLCTSERAINEIGERSSLKNVDLGDVG